MEAAPETPHRLNRALQCASTRVTAWTGTTGALLLAVGFVVAWLATGPMFRWSDTWQLVMNTATSIITFLMVFVIQRAQNKDALAIQLKLDEIVSAVHDADNGMIDIEDLSEEQLHRLRERYRRLATIAGESAQALSGARSGDEAIVKRREDRRAL